MSYSNPGRPPKTQKDVDINRGSYRTFLWRHERLARDAIQKNPAAVLEFAPMLVQRIADERNLRVAWDHLAAEGGHAPGHNGLTYGMLSDGAIWQLMRQLGHDIREGTYSLGPTQKVRVPKSSGRGKRNILLANIEDRVVQRGVTQIIQPLLDPFFDERSFGGRPHRSTWQALATARHFAKYEGRTTWIVEDLRDAFDNVPQRRLLDVLCHRLPDDRFKNLIERLVATTGGRGIAQGSALSPLLMNVYLDHFLDRPWCREGRAPLLRFMDDLLVLCPASDTATAAEEYRALVERLKSIGMPPKGDRTTAIRDLSRGDSVNWLGFRARLHKEVLRYELPIESDGNGWALDLNNALRDCHSKPGAPQRANQVVMGALDQAGPAYSVTPRRSVIRWIREIGADLDFDELPTDSALDYAWAQGRLRWVKCVNRMATRLNGSNTSER